MVYQLPSTGVKETRVLVGAVVVAAFTIVATEVQEGAVISVHL